jgi:hypothetical protein
MGGRLGRRPRHREDQQPGLNFNHNRSENAMNDTVKRICPPKLILLGRHVQSTHYQAREAVPRQLIGRCLFAFQRSLGRWLTASIRPSTSPLPNQQRVVHADVPRPKTAPLPIQKRTAQSGAR